jgi:hypothetical protein
VRGDYISFVSVEQAKNVGCGPDYCPMALNDKAMPPDIKLPAGFVLVHDASGGVFNKCDFYCVRWHGAIREKVEISPADREIARRYFKNARPQVGEVDTPVGPWRRICKVKFIRYRRPGYPRGFEHPYDPAVWLYGCDNALKLSLPGGCVVDDRGFVWP